MAASQAVGPQQMFEQWQAKFNEFKSQNDTVDIAVTTLASAAQGVFIGYLLGSFSMDPASQSGSNPQVSAQLAALQKGGPWGQARNLGVFTGVNAGASLAIKKARGGKEDVWGSMAASFGAGVAFSLVSGVPNPLQAAATTGAAFAGFNGLFYQLSNMFKPDHDDTEYAQAKYMLRVLGLQKYENNLKKGLLTDNTIMLWNSESLAEARIPPGPRLLILHHLDTYRNPSSILKPALPLPMPPPPPAAAGAGAVVARK
ncbi:MAG: hypothetical protein J3K34DRAFT_17793 [Monoraphidium minutum]|nr:MAG: hypothetical protein J3K34DRAFT_17793 [Monoraphidium minutum]